MAVHHSSPRFWRDFFVLLHRYAGLFIAPFIFIAALTGLLYVLTPQLEQYVYRDVLCSQPDGHRAGTLTQQIQVAQAQLPPTAQIVAVRPAPTPHNTTRVMYSDQTHQINNQAVFVDPNTLAVKGELGVYGTSGILPLRTQLDRLHRDLLLGEWGRIYSELAASWMGLLALSGLYHWMIRRKNTSGVVSGTRAQLLKWHRWIGLILLPLLLFFSITGLTWSNWAGSNILSLRQALGWQTPSLNTALSGQTATDAHAAHHEHHQGMVMQMHSMISAHDFELALKLARNEGISANKIQIRPPAAPNQAWIVEEIDRGWPTQVDSVAIDLQQQRVIDHVDFERFPLVAKLTRWGVDAHMGVLFGWPNQLLLVLFALGLCAAILMAYRAWWKTSNFKQSTIMFSQHSLTIWQKGSMSQRIGLILLLGVTSLCLPIFGLSILVALVLILLRRQRL
ncbi:PepSY-associated TM helix domain-containing protein [Acinetobacter soli]|uniref:PepSY-associated TM helix domain-containing protein n=1 Tax=Acinetobacter soli TaxID=487316 RepID=UPI0032B43689